MNFDQRGEAEQLYKFSAMSHEFEVHHHLSQLVSLLHIQDAGEVKDYVDLLLKNRTPYVTTQVSAHTAKRKIAEFSSRGEEFLSKYDELKLRQTRDLDPFVYLLSRMTEDRELCSFLKASRPPPTETKRKDIKNVKVLDLVEGQELELPEKGTVMTDEQLGQFKAKLESITTTLQEREKAKQKGTEVPFTHPPLPLWLVERPYLTRDFVTLPRVPGAVSLGSMPLEMQQQAVLEDLLFAMMGVDGRYIHTEALPTNGMRVFSVDRTLDRSLLSLVNKVLPVCGHYSTVSRFIEDKSKFIHGMVNQALCSSMKGLLKEYLVIIAQLEYQLHCNQLTLQKLWYYVQPCMKTVEILSRIAVSVDKGMCRGGKTLTTLHHITCGYIGDERSLELCLHLAQTACRPYFEMLEKWIYRGEVVDPYAEFMIKEHEMINKELLHEKYNDAYWERRYTVCQENIPSFFEHITEKILTTGKYLNVVRECGQEVDFPDSLEVKYSVQERHYVEQIEKAHAYASKKLLDLMIEDQDLLGYLRSIKHYFLLDQGDLLVHFLDMAQEELYKPISEIHTQRLESLLEVAVRTSLADHDPYKDNVRPQLVPYDVVTQLLYITDIQPENVGSAAVPPPPILRPDADSKLSALEAFCLDYKVKWPLSLVISRKCLFRYQVLFRHLFYCKHVERQLCATWSSYKGAKKCSLLTHSWYSSAFALLQRMLNFVQNLQYYTMFEVLEPNWTHFERCLRSVTTIDDVLSAHNDFLNKCLHGCMLSNRELLEILSRLMTICTSFTSHMQHVAVSESGKDLARQSKPPVLRSRLLVAGLDDLVSNVNFGETIVNFDKQFTQELVILLDKLRLSSVEDSITGSMVSRLNFNSFYKGESET